MHPQVRKWLGWLKHAAKKDAFKKWFLRRLCLQTLEKPLSKVVSTAAAPPNAGKQAKVTKNSKNHQKAQNIEKNVQTAQKSPKTTKIAFRGP